MRQEMNRKLQMEKENTIDLRRLCCAVVLLVFMIISWGPVAGLASPGSAPVKAAPASAQSAQNKTASTGQAKKTPGLSNAQKTPASAATSAKASRFKKGERELLWKMTSDSGATLYLLGTIHVFKPQDYPLPDEMEKAFAKARALIVEVDVTKSDKQFVQTFVGTHGVYPRGDSLPQHVTPSCVQLLKDYCEKRKIAFEAISRMKPWLAGLTILEKEMAILGYLPETGIDLHFLGEANKQGKKVISLETLAFQLGLFAGLPEDLQEMDLNLSLVDLAKLPTDAGDMMNAWMKGDDRAMDEVMTRDIKEHPELAPVQEKLLYDRNITMAEKLEAYLKGGSDTYLVAIGTAHLVGDRSVISHLIKKGYKVQQVHVGDSI